MRRADYLTRLRESAKQNNLIDAAGGELMNIANSPVNERAVAAIMRKTGFSEEMIVKRFGYNPEQLDQKPQPQPRRF